MQFEAWCTMTAPRSRPCGSCGRLMPPRVGRRGHYQRYCSLVCEGVAKAARLARRAPCAVDGCSTLARLRGALCEKHYHRQHRHGRVDAHVFAAGITVSKGRRYRHFHAPTHPLAMRNGMVYEHRAALFSAIGYGPHLCHWCATPLTWRRNLHVDHLDDVGDNNDPSNLVPACNRCNSGRGVAARRAAVRRAGFFRIGAAA